MLRCDAWLHLIYASLTQGGKWIMSQGGGQAFSERDLVHL